MPLITLDIPDGYHVRLEGPRTVLVDPDDVWQVELADRWGCGLKVTGMGATPGDAFNDELERLTGSSRGGQRPPRCNHSKGDRE